MGLTRGVAKASKESKPQKKRREKKRSPHKVRPFCVLNSSEMLNCCALYLWAARSVRLHHVKRKTGDNIFLSVVLSDTVHYYVMKRGDKSHRSPDLSMTGAANVNCNSHTIATENVSFAPEN